MTAQDVRRIDTAYRKRAQTVLSVDRMIGDLRATLEKAGVADRTVVLFTSDNGFHMGEHRLTPGKQTAFDTDVTVPLIVAGEGVRAGVTVEQPVENIDLRPSFEQLGGLTSGPGVDGRSLVPLLAGEAPADWKKVGLVEHHSPRHRPRRSRQAGEGRGESTDVRGAARTRLDLRRIQRPHRRVLRQRQGSRPAREPGGDPAGRAAGPAAQPAQPPAGLLRRRRLPGRRRLATPPTTRRYGCVPS
ncbi:sulfatase-like hydrolase/transferase [Paractinoplanes ovalisporus]|uniref:sulfatase-like hydrolase/transferase n=1 Tax=Paractinoplanes ovalisporus TaxID=2810368 RepID=UPI0022A69425|nr:sulfatase-like hydrolase/transferase [Actinoplanes ovalisporus]